MHIRKQERSLSIFRNCGILRSIPPRASPIIFYLVILLVLLIVLLTCMLGGTFSSNHFLPGTDVIRTVDTNHHHHHHHQMHDNHEQLGAVVILAPQRNEMTWWASTSRFCFLMRAVRSIDQHVNQHYGPYPIYILVTKDYALDPRHKDGPYTTKDQAFIRSWAPHTPEIIFQEINLYSDDALEPNTTIEQIMSWRQHGNDGAIPGRDLGYQSMCRLWSGRLQQMSFLQPYSYYLRMDDDSLLVDKFPFDPFLYMHENNLDYLWRRDSVEEWGVAKLNELLQKHKSFLLHPTLFLSQLGSTPDDYEYMGEEPYNNFHISRISFWSEPKWQTFWHDLNTEHAFLNIEWEMPMYMQQPS